NSKKERRVMNIDEILKFCDATLERVLENVKKINLDFGVRVSGGAEDILHSINRVLREDKNDRFLAMLTVDFLNSFNLVDKSTLLYEVKVRETYGNNDYDPYDDDIYESREIAENIQSICDNLDIKNVKTIKNVIEDESHFVMKVIDNDLGALCSINSNDGRGGGGLMVLGGRSSMESKSVYQEVGGVKKMSSMGSKLMVRGEECLEGCVGVSGGEVSRGGDDFEVSKSLLGEIFRVMIGEGGGETFGDDRGPVW
ncbi:hypothetical protein Tco_1100238, partial [Tanacetum coccineum]